MEEEVVERRNSLNKFWSCPALLVVVIRTSLTRTAQKRRGRVWRGGARRDRKLHSTHSEKLRKMPLATL